MKKIILTLGVFLSIYATYAMNSDIEINKEDENSVKEVVLEEDSCQRVVYHYNEDNTLSYVSVHIC